jgi:hypothetical protein
MLVYHRLARARCHYQEFGAVTKRFIERLLGAIACSRDGGQRSTSPLLTKVSRMGNECAPDALSPFADRDVDRKYLGRIEGEQRESRESVCVFGNER